MTECTPIYPHQQPTPITEAEALAFVQNLRPVGLVSLSLIRLVQTDTHPRGLAYVAARWKPQLPTEIMRFSQYHASEIERSPHAVMFHVQKRGNGSVFAQSYVCGDPWVQDWCRPLEAEDTFQDDPIPDDIFTSDEECCQPTLAHFAWSLAALDGVDTPYPIDPTDQANPDRCEVIRAAGLAQFIITSAARL